jgi:hypothetical protein
MDGEGKKGKRSQKKQTKINFYFPLPDEVMTVFKQDDPQNKS